MAITGYELITVQGDLVTADLLVWRRYRYRARGIVEALLDLNPHLSRVHRVGPFIPPGVQVRIPIDPVILANSPKRRPTITLWGANLAN
jgi:phage tail protein X